MLLFVASSVSGSGNLSGFECVSIAIVSAIEARSRVCDVLRET